MSRAVAGVKPLCGLARVVSENSLRATKGPLRWTGGASAVATSHHREVVIYVYTAMISSRLGREYKRHYGAGTGNYLPAKPPERAAYLVYRRIPSAAPQCPRARSVELFIFEQSPRLYQSFLSAPFLSGARAGAAGMSGTKKVWPG
jgi:hypothetical protein